MKTEDLIILNIDDDEAGRYAKTRILRRAGYQVLDAGTGTEALNIAHENKPQLILLDVMLPDINGLEVCRILKSDPQTAHIMILQVSATHVTEADRVQGLEGGADGYLTEPLEAEELLASVKALLRLYSREEENRRLLAQLRDADRQKDEFLATLAHELRNPLHPIRGAVEMMRLSDSLEPELQLSRDIIDQQLSHLSRLIDDLLDVARITRDSLVLRKERLSLTDVLRSGIEASRSFMDAHGQQVIAQYPSGPVEIEGDLVRLTQVLVNLLSNAAKYTPRGKGIWLRAWTQNGSAIIAVKDEGIGIASDQLSHIFDKFYQIDRSLERSESGLGLGLTLVRKLVELHGGKVDARSAGLGKGSEFVISLPLPPGREKEKTNAAATPGRATAAVPRRILIVDDGARTREMYSLLLRRQGHEVETAADGHSAIETVEHFHPNAVLLDVGMPGLNGFDTCQRIRERHGTSLTLIAVTGWAQYEVQERAEKAGFDAILVKPVGVQEILQTIDRLLEEKAGTDRRTIA
jgi:two-component system, sensor histidine kinase